MIDVPYVLSLVLLVVALLLLAATALATYRRVRRLQGVQREVTADIRDRFGLVRARMAGLRIAIAQRFGRTAE